jgi:hypothetical protein
VSEQINQEDKQMITIRRRSTSFIIAVSCALALGACGKQEAPPPAATPAPAPAPAPAPPPVAAPVAPVTTFTSIALGNAVDADGKVAASSVTFAPKDTIYAVVTTTSTGMANATVSAKWTYQGGVPVSSGEEKIAANGPATTTFHIAKPDGFPVGRYTIEISIDGKISNSTSFDVK